MTPIYLEQRVEALELEIAELRRRLAVLEAGQEEYISTTEAAEALGVHPNTIKNMIDDGRLPAAKIGRNWKIARSEVLAMLESAR